jgi:hypothetical protein
MSTSKVFGQYTDLNKYKTFNRIEKQLIKVRIALDTPDSTVYANVMEGKFVHNPREDRYYYWFMAGQIKRTRGGVDGKVLHGKYTAYYFNKSLKQKGLFYKGLKNGRWISWYPNGEINSISHWKKGILNGEYSVWSPEGKLVEKGNYKNERKVGEWQYISKEGYKTTKRYRNGDEYIGPSKIAEKKKLVVKMPAFLKFKKKEKAKANVEVSPPKPIMVPLPKQKAKLDSTNKTKQEVVQKKTLKETSK